MQKIKQKLLKVKLFIKFLYSHEILIKKDVVKFLKIHKNKSTLKQNFKKPKNKVRFQYYLFTQFIKI